MTVQSSELLIYDGQEFAMREKPLETLFRMGRERPPFVVRTTACWRGYFGTWTLTGSRLRLIALRGYIAKGNLIKSAGQAFRYQIDTDDPSICVGATLDAVFPGFADSVFAHWYSGSIDAINAENRPIKLVAKISRGIVVEDPSLTVTVEEL